MVKVAGAFKTVPVAIVGVVDEKIDSKVMMHKIEKAPPETFDVRIFYTCGQKFLPATF